MADATVTSINASGLGVDSYSILKTSNLTPIDLDTTFNTSSDYIEYYIYDVDINRVYPEDFSYVNPNIYTNYRTINSFVIPSTGSNDQVLRDIIVNPANDVETLADTISGIYNSKYCFYTKRCASSPTTRYFISEISSDRTELKLDSTQIGAIDVIASTQEFLQYRLEQTHFVDFYLNFGNNVLLLANNIALEITDPTDPKILIKLVNPLPTEILDDVQLWIVESTSDPYAYQIEFPDFEVSSLFSTGLKGPNLSLAMNSLTNNSTQPGDKTNLTSNTTSSFKDQLNYLISASNSVTTNVNYNSYPTFVKFSSALTRLENFNYKAGIIESASNELTILNSITGSTPLTWAYSESIDKQDGIVTDTINNFTPYEYWLYYDSGSTYSWPKSTVEPPYTLYSTGSATVLDWLGSVSPSSSYYGGVSTSASVYDGSNMDMLYNCLPMYVKDDAQNEPLFLLIDMFGEMYDSVWLYQQAITDKYNADNRLDFGISKDLIFTATRDIGVTLYANNFSSDNVYTSLLGVNQQGNYTIPDTTSSLGAVLPRGYQYVSQSIYSTNISSSLFPMDDLSKKIYKRIYHNAPYLFKTKGTKESIRTLLNIYGIPDTILQINEFGNKDKDNTNDWDYYYEKFNNALTTTGSSYVEIPFGPSPDEPDVVAPALKPGPRGIEFRFKTFGMPNVTTDARFSQSLWNITSSNAGGIIDTMAVVLEYTGSAGTNSGSYSGSITSSYEEWGDVKFLAADSAGSMVSASVFGPYFDGGWHSVLVTTGSAAQWNLEVKNKIYSGSDGTQLGFQSSSIVSVEENDWKYTGSLYLGGKGDNHVIGVNGKTYRTFSGSLQEFRYYKKSLISGSAFDDYTMNPQSFEGNGLNVINSISSSITSSMGVMPDSKNILQFRADLGGEKFD